MRKVQVLRFLEGNKEQDVRQVAQACQITFQAAGMLLLRLFRQGLVKKELDAHDHVFFYSLTSKGLARLGFYSQKPKDPAI